MRYSLLIVLLISVNSFSQFKNDNVSYKTVYLDDLCTHLQKNPGFLILDVRSKGEHYDTSQNLGLNLGHFNNALNIDIRELPARINELAAYKDKPIFVHCSHSQRSRRVSKMLADSGYAKVFNINGGVSSLYTQGINYKNCPSVQYVTNNAYKLIGARELNQQVQAGNQYFIVDIRPDSVFDGVTTDERKKAGGVLQDAMNIPLDKLASQLPTLRISRPILVVDDFGSDSPKAVKILKENGFDNITVLYGGMDGWLQFASEESKLAIKHNSHIKYAVITSHNLDKFLNTNKPVIIDVRTAEEFNNTSKETFRNVGRMKNAINVPFATIKAGDLSQIPSGNKILLYAFSGQPEVFESARILSEKGYDVTVLHGGLFNVRWRAANLKGKEKLHDLVVNVPAENF